MKERPILFSGPMVRAIIEGRKTQTRRVVKPGTLKPNVRAMRFENCDAAELVATHRCPYGQPGDRLWVKETWRPAWHEELYCSVQYAADSSYRKPEITDEYRGHRFADMCDQSGDHAEPWHPSIHMWREFSRLTLEVVAVRVERLQAISGEDVLAEGIERPLRREYAELWESINGAGSWDANPWVWVVEFRRLTNGEA